jgi:hypothetical protein
MTKDDEKRKRKHDDVVDLASRIGARREGEPQPKKEEPPAPPPPPARFDAPIPPAPKPRLIPTREDRDQGALIRKALADETETTMVAIPSPRGAPGPGEVDLVVTPLPTPDDWHRFELALRKIKGVAQLRTEYYRHGVLKVRVTYQGEGRLAAALRAGVPGYRVRVIGEDRATLQILVASEGDDRRPG